MIALSDDPRRRPARSAFQRAFSIDLVAGRRTMVRGWVDELLTEAERRAGDRPIDVVDAFALPLTAAVLNDLIGLDALEGNHIRLQWSAVSATVDDPSLPLPADAPRLLAEILELLSDALERARTKSAELPIGMLTAGVNAGELDRNEVAANLLFVLTSGHRSLAQALALMIHTLATHPHQFRRLGSDPELAPHAVEELLRWDGPVHLIQRVTATATMIEGCNLAAGEPVMLFLAAANRDQRAFQHADVLDLTARSAHHVAFGHGPHFCVGATVARMVLREAVGALAERCPGLRLAGDAQWTVPRRGLDHLWVRW
jgi:cytochrome P450